MKISDLILLQNRQFIALNKPSGIPVQPDKTKDLSLLELAKIYCKHELYPINRIDRPASGVILFAKTKSAATRLGNQLKDGKMSKIYWAVVGKKPETPERKLTNYLFKDGRLNKTFVTDKNIKDSKEAILTYTLKGSSDRYHLLEIKLITGRHHQIRAQLGAIENPVKGDVKYGFRRANKDRSIHLHAFSIAFQHPTTNEKTTVEAPLPDDPLWNYFKDLNSTQSNSKS